MSWILCTILAIAVTSAGLRVPENSWGHVCGWLLVEEVDGLDIEDYVIQLAKDRHRLKPDGLHTGPDNWNAQWKRFFEEAGRRPTAKQILDQLEKMRKDFELD